jgi:MFS family permease
MSVVGGRFLLTVGYRTISIIGFIVLTTGFVFLSLFQIDTPRTWLYVDLVLIGAGLGLTMLTLLIAVQQAVEKTKLGVATSLNQFSRAIGGAFGVAIMGAVLTAGLATQLNDAAQSGTANLTVAQAAEFAANPNALIVPEEQAKLPAGVLPILQEAMATSIHKVFWVGAILSALALLVIFLLPKHGDIHKTDENAGETMLMAEQTTINARNQPDSTEN